MSLGVYVLGGKYSLCPWGKCLGGSCSGGGVLEPWLRSTYMGMLLRHSV